MHGKPLWKLVIIEIAEASRGVAAGPHTGGGGGGFTLPPSCKGQHTDAC